MKRPPTVSAQGSGATAIGGNVGSITYVGTQVLDPSSVPVDVAAVDPREVFAVTGVDAFTGRAWLTDEVDQFLAGTAMGYLFIEANAGMGKTAFAAWLVKSRSYLSHFSRYGTSVREALQNLSAQLIRDCGLRDQAPGGRLPTWAQTPSGFDGLLRKAAEGRDSARPLVLVVDGLNEAETLPGGLPFGLPLMLPRGVYVIATYRTGSRPRRPEVPSRTVRIAAADPRNRLDIREFLTAATREAVLAARLSQARMDAADFIGLLTERCDGVWVYLRYVLEEVRRELRSADTIADLPTGLRSYYIDQITHWQGDPAWDQALLPFLATLGAAQEPLPAATLARLAGHLEPATVRRWCDQTIRPWLSAVRGGTDTPDRYEVYHASFREVLEGALSPGTDDDFEPPDDALSGELQEAAITAHGRIAGSYLDDFGGLDKGLSALGEDLGAARVDGGYPLRHLTHHLQRAQRAAELDRLLAAEYPAGSPHALNVWSAAHDHGDCLVSYLEDLRRARDASAVATSSALARRIQAPSLGKETRCALMAASIASRTDHIPTVLLEQAVHTGIWSLARGLDHARRLSDPGHRIEALIAICGHLPADEQPDVLGEALAAVAELAEDSAIANALVALAPHLPADLIAGALSAATALTEHDDRARALAALAPYLPSGLLAGTLAADRLGTDDADRAAALAALAPHLPVDLLASALEAATALSDEDAAARVLAALAPHLPVDLLARALEAANSLTGNGAVAQALTALAVCLPADQRPGVLARALRAAKAISKVYDRSRALLDLVPHLPADLRDEALAAVRAATGDLGAEDLASLASRMPADERAGLLAQALDQVGRVNDELSQRRLLTTVARALTPDMPADLLGQALEAGAALGDGVFGSEVLAEMAERMPTDQRPPVYARALAAADGVPDAVRRGMALTELANRVPADQRPAVIAQALPAVSALRTNSFYQVGLVNKLAPLLPAGERNTLLAESLARVAAIEDSEFQAMLLADLIPHMGADLLAEALAAATAIPDGPSRARALARLSARLSGGRQADAQAQALAAAAAITVAEGRAAVLAQLAFYLPASRQDEVIAQALSAVPEDSGRARTLAELASCLPEERRPGVLAQAMAAADATTDGDSRAAALAAVAAQLPAGQRTGALIQALISSRTVVIGGDAASSGLEALAMLVPYLPAEMLAEVVRVVTAETDSEGRAQVLAAIAPALPVSLPEHLLSEAVLAVVPRVRTALGPRTSVLADLARHQVAGRLPAVLAQIVAAVSASQDDGIRAAALEALAPYLPPELATEALAAAVSIGDQLARARTVAALASRVPPGKQADAVGEVLAAAAPLGYGAYRGSVLAVIASAIPEEHRLPLVQGALAELAMGLPAAIPDTYEERRAQALARMVPALPAEYVTEMIATMPNVIIAPSADDCLRAEALADLAPCLTGDQPLGWAVGVARSILDDGMRVRALAALAPHLPDGQRHGALADALATATSTDESQRAGALTDLAPQLPAELLQEAVNASVATTGDRYRALALLALVPSLPSEQQAGALVQALVAATADGSVSAAALAALAPHLPDDRQADASAQAVIAAVASATTREYVPAAGLAAVAPCLSSSLLATAVAAAAHLTDGPARAAALLTLVPVLPADQQPGVLEQALTAASAIVDDRPRMRVLADLIPRLPADRRRDVLQKTLAAVAGIADDYARAASLAALAPCLPADLLPEALAAAPQTMPIARTAVLRQACARLAEEQRTASADLLRMGLDGTDRITCLDVIAEAAPLIEELGGMTAIQECAAAIVDVHRWWP